MKALISPNEKVISKEGVELGARVAQTGEESFDVAPPLFWIDYDPKTLAEGIMYYADGNIQSIPISVEETANTQPTN